MSSLSALIPSTQLTPFLPQAHFDIGQIKAINVPSFPGKAIFPNASPSISRCDKQNALSAMAGRRSRPQPVNT
jgi:hypothetical protein